MSTGYYTPDMTPPGYEGKTWPHRLVERDEHGEQTERMVPSPFPPATMGVPAEDLPAFRDFQNHQSRNRKQEHPDWYCQDCGIRYANVVCKEPGGCGSARVEYPNAMRALYHCLACERRFAADRLCGPCIERRQQSGQLRTTTEPARSATPKTHHPARRPAAVGARR